MRLGTCARLISNGRDWYIADTVFECKGWIMKQSITQFKKSKSNASLLHSKENVGATHKQRNKIYMYKRFSLKARNNLPVAQ